MTPTSSEITTSANVIMAVPELNRFVLNWNSDDGYTDPSNGTYEISVVSESDTELQIVRQSCRPVNGKYSFQRITFKSDAMKQIDERTQETVRQCDMSALETHNREVLLLFRFLLIELNRQHPASGKVKFSTDDLCRLYGSADSAYKGFYRGAMALRGLTIESWRGATTDDEPMSDPDYKNVQLVGSFGRENGRFYVMVDPAILSRCFFTFVPEYAFSLNSVEEELLQHICSEARQKAEEILSNGFFKIRMNTVRCWLNLPFAAGPHADRTVKRIAKAVQNINKAQQACDDPEALRLEMPDSSGIRAKDFFSKEYLTVFVSGTYAESFKPIVDAKLKRKARAEKLKDEVEVRKRLQADKKRRRKKTA